VQWFAARKEAAKNAAKERAKKQIRDKLGAALADEPDGAERVAQAEKKMDKMEKLAQAPRPTPF